MPVHRLAAALAAALFFAASTASAKGVPQDRIAVLPTPISGIQGNGSVSPIVGTTVTVEGLVTARIATGFFIQSRAASVDGDDATSEGLFVFTGTTPDSKATVGNLVRIVGQVEEFTPAADPNQLPVTRLLPTTLTQLATGRALPAHVVIPPEAMEPGQDVEALERYEGMRVDLPLGLKVTGPTESTWDETTARATSTGVFHAVYANGLNPFREPGLPLLDAAEPPAGKSIPRYDGNPERIRVDSAAQPGAWRLKADVGGSVSNTRGVLHYAEGAYTLMPDPDANLGYGSGDSPAVAVDPLPARQLRLAWMDLDRLFDTGNDPALDEPVPAASAYAERLAKIAEQICLFAPRPDVLAVTGVETAQVLADVKAAIAAEPSYCPGHPAYQVVHVDGGRQGLDLGFLVGTRSATATRPSVQVLEYAAFGGTATFTAPDGTVLPLFEQAPLRVRVRFAHVGEDPFEVDFVAVQLQGRELLAHNEPGPHGWATMAHHGRALRAAQAGYLAQWLQTWQQTSPERALAMLGGFDAHEFSDGQVDVLGLLTGQQVPAHKVWLPLANPLTRPLHNLTLQARPQDRYSTIVDGIAEATDHVLVNTPLLARFTALTQHPHGNSVFARAYSTTPELPRFNGLRDPIVVDLAARAVSQADGALGEVTTWPVLSPHNNNELAFLLDNLGPDSAPQMTVQVSSSLPAGAWGLYIDDLAWRCMPPEAIVGGGSRMHCTRPEVSANDTKFVRIPIPANPALQGLEARFDIAVSGGYTDPQPANDTLAITTRFEGNGDLAVSVTADQEVVPTTHATFYVPVENTTNNDPGTVTLVVTVDAPLADVTMYDVSSSLGITCTSVDLAGGKSRWTCVHTYPGGSNDVMRMGFQVKTALLDGGRRIGLDAVVTSTKADTNAGNNHAVGTATVSDKSDLRVVPWEDSAEYFNLDDESRIGFTVDTGEPGVVRNAELELDIGVTPDRIAGVAIYRNIGVGMEWSCDPARDGTAGRSRISCRSSEPLLDTDSHPVSWFFLVRINAPLVPGQATSTISGNATVSSDSEEVAPADNTATAQITIDQTADFAVYDATDAGARTLEPAPSEHLFRLSNEGRNRVRFGVLFVDIGTVTDPAQVVVRSFNDLSPLPCIPVSAVTGRTRLRCTAPATILGPNDPAQTWISVSVPTRPDLYGQDLIVRLQATNQLVEVNEANNKAASRVRVDADADLCTHYASGGCHLVDVPLAKVAQGSRATLPLHLRNRGPSTAVGTRATLQVALPPARVSASVAGGTCDAAVASGTGSRVECRIGDLVGDSAARAVMLTLDAAGNAVDDLISIRIDVASDRPDSQPENSTDSFDVRVVTAVDLQARIATKSPGRSHGAPLEFHLFTGVGAGETGESSWLEITVAKPLLVPAPVVVATGWRCYDPSGSSGVAWTCYRIAGPIPSGAEDRVVLRFEVPGFLRIGERIEADMAHVFHHQSLVADPSPENARATATAVPGGRETQSRPTPLRPILEAPVPHTGDTYAPARSRGVRGQAER